MTQICDMTLSFDTVGWAGLASSLYKLSSLLSVDAARCLCKVRHVMAWPQLAHNNIQPRTSFTRSTQPPTLSGTGNE